MLDVILTILPASLSRPDTPFVPGSPRLTGTRGDERNCPQVCLQRSATSWSGCDVRTSSCGWSAIFCQKPRLVCAGDRHAAVRLFQFMSANQASFPIAAMARVFGVSRAGYYAWRQRPASAHAMADAALLKHVRTIHASSRQTYGAPRVHADLRRRGERHSRKRIARLMREAGLMGASHRRGGPITTRPDKAARPAADPGLRRGRLWSTATSARPSRTSCG